MLKMKKNGIKGCQKEMKLRNKKNGEIITKIWWDKEVDALCLDGKKIYFYDSLAELNENWEDYKDPKIKKYWWVSPLDCGAVEDDLKWNESEYDDEIDKFNVEIGNYFKTEKEAEQAVEKLKAWKRLKDKGFKTIGWTIDDGLRVSICTNLDSDGIYDEGMKETKEDLDICFGGEE